MRLSFIHNWLHISTCKDVIILKRCFHNNNNAFRWACGQYFIIWINSFKDGVITTIVTPVLLYTVNKWPFWPLVSKMCSEHGNTSRNKATSLTSKKLFYRAKTHHKHTPRLQINANAVRSSYKDAKTPKIQRFLQSFQKFLASFLVYHLTQWPRSIQRDVTEHVRAHTRHFPRWNCWLKLLWALCVLPLQSKSTPITELPTTFLPIKVFSWRNEISFGKQFLK